MGTCLTCRFHWVDAETGVPYCRRYPSHVMRKDSDWCGEHQKPILDVWIGEPQPQPKLKKERK